MFSIAPFSDTIAGDDSIWVYILLAPNVAGMQNGNIIFQHNATSSPDTLIVSGTDTTNIYFGNFQHGTISGVVFNDRAGKQWHISLYSNAVNSSTLEAESSSDTLLAVENLTDGNYIAVESDSSFASSNALISLSVSNGQTKNVSCINALKRDAIVIDHYLDTDSIQLYNNKRPPSETLVSRIIQRKQSTGLRRRYDTT